MPGYTHNAKNMEKDTTVKEIPLKTDTHYFNDIGYVAVSEVFEYYVDFKVYKPLKGSHLLYERIGGISNLDNTSDIKEAQVFLSGSVRFDGCSNWYFDEQDTVMIHCCSKEELTNIGMVMARCWDLTAELCPIWIGD